MKLAFLLLACVPALFAQDHYIASASTTAMTLQQPSVNARQVSFPDGGRAGASVYCASASTATISWNGTAATATAGTTIRIPPTNTPSAATVWTGSNAGAGTTGPVYNVAAAQTFQIDFGWFRMGASGTSNNLTITTSNSCTITFMWGEM